MTLGDVIHQYRTEHSLSMEQFAAKSGLSKAYVALLEKNEHPKTKQPITPSIVTFKCAADAIGISLDELLGKVDENQPVYIVANPNKNGRRIIDHIEPFRSDKGVRLVCKIDSGLYDNLAIAAEENGRTLEDEIEERLHESIQQDMEEYENQHTETEHYSRPKAERNVPRTPETPGPPASGTDTEDDDKNTVAFRDETTARERDRDRGGGKSPPRTKG